MNKKKNEYLIIVGLNRTYCTGRNGYRALGFLDDKEAIQVYQKQRKNEFVKYLSRTLILASPIEIKHLLKQSKNREKYDLMCEESRIIQTVDQNTNLIRFFDRKYSFVREFCILRHDHTASDGKVYIVSNSISTPLCPEKDIYRGIAIDSGFVMEQKGKGKSLLTYITQVNLNTWAPNFVIELTIKQQMIEVLKQIRNHFERKYERTEGNRVRSLS